VRALPMSSSDHTEASSVGDEAVRGEAPLRSLAVAKTRRTQMIDIRLSLDWFREWSNL
jgi:hypothetical protein